MEKLNITQGEWIQDGLYIDAEDGSLIATIHSEDSIENEANGKLMALAGNLAQKYNLEALPDLVAVLQEIMLDDCMKGILLGETRVKAKKALNKLNYS